MLGILEFHPTAADLVYLGSVQDQGRDPPADTNRIIPLSLVLGNVLPWVCVNGDVFVKYFARDDLNGNEPPENPIEKGLTSLRALNTQFAPPLRRHTRRSAEPQAPREQGLHTRQLPPSMGDPVHVHGPGPRVITGDPSQCSHAASTTTTLRSSPTGIWTRGWTPTWLNTMQIGRTAFSWRLCRRFA